MEYLTWRVWSIKQKRSAAASQRLRLLPEDDDNDARTDSCNEDDDGRSDASGIDVATPKRISEQHRAALARRGGDVVPVESPLSSPVLEAADLWEHRVDRLYIILISMHGLVRGEGMELGRDPDTGGQVRGQLAFCCECSGRLKGEKGGEEPRARRPKPSSSLSGDWFAVQVPQFCEL